MTWLQAQVYDIDLAKLPSDQEFRKGLDDFMPLYQYVAAWNPEWKANIPKSKVIEATRSLLAKVDSLAAKSGNQSIDLLLLRAVLKSCLYNANLDEYHPRVVADLKAIKAKYPTDYRAYWLLANHYGFADDPFSAMKEYETLFTQVLQGKGSQAVLADFLAANFYTFMFSRCKVIIDDLARQNNIKDVKGKFWMYEDLLLQLQGPPTGSFLPKEMIYTTQLRELEIGFLNRALGIWIPVKSTWTTEALGVTSDGVGNFTIRYPLKTAKAGMVTTSFSITFQANPKQSFETFMDKILQLPTKKQEITNVILRWPAKVYEYWDSESFESSGGGHGLIIFIKRSAPENKGLAIEAPAKLPTKDQNEGINYVVLGEGYTRFNGDIYYAFILDCAEQVSIESKKEFLGFMNRVLLD